MTAQLRVLLSFILLIEFVLSFDNLRLRPNSAAQVSVKPENN